MKNLNFGVRIHFLWCFFFFGTIYHNASAQFTKVYDFQADNYLKAPRYGELVTDGTYLYGTASSGGVYASGGIYRIKTDGTAYLTIHDFNGTTEGGSCNSGLAISGSILYGATTSGGTIGHGTIFQVNTDGTGYTVLFNFNNNTPNFEGRNCWTQMIISGNVLYGVTYTGGSSNNGTLYKYDLGGGGYTKLRDFDNTNGKGPIGTLAIYGSTLFGTTYNGGSSGLGVVYKILTDGTGFTKLHDQTAALGSNPNGGVVLIGNTLYGSTYFGGTSGVGVIFSMDTTGGSYTILKHFTGPPGPDRSLCHFQVSGNVLYGTTNYGGAFQSSGNGGTVFKYDLGAAPGSEFTNLHDLVSSVSEGNWIWSSVKLIGTELFWITNIGGTSNQGTLSKINTDGTGYTKLLDFNKALNGSVPFGALTLVGSVFYGVTNSSGANAAGCIFKYDPASGVYTNLLDFTGNTGAAPGSTSLTTLTPSADGTILYGTTRFGGTNGKGVIFQVNADGTGYTVLLNFDGNTGTMNGSSCRGSLIRSGSMLYGMAYDGGSSNLGCVFQMDLTQSIGSQYTKLLDFTGAANGSNPRGALTISGTKLYGMTLNGGASAKGSLFQLDLTQPIGSQYTKLLDFTGTAGVAIGANPWGTLTVSGTNLYGMTQFGGTSNLGCIFKIDLTQAIGSQYSKLFDFTGAANGSTPMGSFTLVGNVLYGMTQLGGTNAYGVLFQYDLGGGGYTKLFDFDGSANGRYPYSELTFYNHNLYGMTNAGGTGDIGTIFKFTNTLLPIELISFNARGSDGKVLTSWVTASETNNDYFTVERSKNGTNFESFAIVKGAGNSSRKLNYSATDERAYNGISYYRLKQTDFDGKYSYSNIVPVDFTTESKVEFSVYPNPVKLSDYDKYALSLSGLRRESPVLVVLYDLMGKEFYSKVLMTSDGGQAELLIESSEPLPRGVYLIRASGNDRLLSKKVVVE